MAKRIPILLDLIKVFSENEIYEHVKISASYVRLIGYGHKQASAKVAISLERITGGAVRRTDLRPDWIEIWPEYDARRPARGDYPVSIVEKVNAFAKKHGVK